MPLFEFKNKSKVAHTNRFHIFAEPSGGFTNPRRKAQRSGALKVRGMCKHIPKIKELINLEALFAPLGGVSFGGVTADVLEGVEVVLTGCTSTVGVIMVGAVEMTGSLDQSAAPIAALV